MESTRRAIGRERDWAAEPWMDWEEPDMSWSMLVLDDSFLANMMETLEQSGRI